MVKVILMGETGNGEGGTLDSDNDPERHRCIRLYSMRFLQKVCWGDEYDTL